jgi:ABC-type siderophore export system fused ATPase/permease subunit
MLFPYLHVAFILLPALAAMASILVARCLSAYLLLASGTIYVVLVLVILVFFEGGAVA